MNWNTIKTRIETTGIHTFGEPATYHAQSGETYPIMGIFTDRFEAIDPDSGVVVQSTQPTLTVNQLPQLPHANDAVSIGQRTYQVIEAKPNEGGAVELRLMLASAD